MILARVSERLPLALIDTLREQWAALSKIDDQVSTIERRLQQAAINDSGVRAITAIPGVGTLTATAAVASMGDVRAFRSGREFAAWIGLVPRQAGSGGKVVLGRISRRGDTYLRTLLIHGARSVMYRLKQSTPWLDQIKQRRPANVVVVAIANKIARIIWAVLSHGCPYQQGHVSKKPA